MWPAARGPIVVTAAGSPPPADTRISGPVTLGANTMTPSAFHVPPLPLVAAVSVCGAPPPRSNRLSAPGAKKPTERPSGDQKGAVAPSVPGKGCAVAVDSERNHRRDDLSSVATK